MSQFKHLQIENAIADTMASTILSSFLTTAPPHSQLAFGITHGQPIKPIK